MKNLSFFIKAYCCLINKDWFLKQLLQKDFEEELASNEQLRTSQEKQIEDFKVRLRESTLHRRDLLKKKLFLSFRWIFTAIVAVLILISLTHQINLNFGKLTAILSVFCFSWATLARLGWKGQSYGGDSVFEQLDENILWVLYFGGTFFATISLLI